jgi:Uri superfamily endonuclease
LEDHTIRLNSIEYQGTVLIANFTIENLGTSDLNVSSMLSFSAKKDDGTKLDQEIFDCGTSNLGGSVLPGDKLRGNICWSGASPEDDIKIYYEASLFGQGAVVWNATEGVTEDLDTGAGETPQIEMFKVGDIVELQDHTIRLNSLEYRGTVLVADFTIENLGDSDISVSSMLSFSAKNSDGTKLEAEYFDCGTSSLDGKILPGDRLRQYLLAEQVQMVV